MGTTFENRARKRRVWELTTVYGRVARKLAVTLSLIGGIAWIAGASGGAQARIWLACGVSIVAFCVLAVVGATWGEP